MLKTPICWPTHWYCTPSPSLTSRFEISMWNVNERTANGLPRTSNSVESCTPRSRDLYNVYSIKIIISKASLICSIVNFAILYCILIIRRSVRYCLNIFAEEILLKSFSLQIKLDFHNTLMLQLLTILNLIKLY